MRKLSFMAWLCWASFCWSGSLFPDDFDQDFDDAAIFLPAGIDPRLLKAQCYQESLLNPLAVSHVGAAGLCQFMPGTWRDMQTRYPDLSAASQFDPAASIMAAALYMHQMHIVWKAPRPIMDRHMLALASYNWGAGNVIKSQKRCGGSAYRQIEPCVTPGETRHYVRVIVGKWYPAMLFD